MKKKAIQTLIYLANNNIRREASLNNHNIHSVFNSIPKTSQINIKKNATQYAQQQLELNYGIRIEQHLSKQDQQTAKQIIERIKQIKKMKSIRLAQFVQKFNKRINYGELQQANEFLKTLNGKDVKELGITLDLMQKVIRQKLERGQTIQETHTIRAAQNLIQELQKTRKLDQV